MRKYGNGDALRGGAEVSGPPPGTGFSARGAGTTTRRSGVSRVAPPIFSFRRAEKRKRAVHGPLHSPWRLCRLGLRRPPCGEKRKGRFWSSHKCTPFLDQTGGSLTRGRRDVLLFPRFAPSLYRVGGITDHFLSVERCRGDDPSPVPSQFRTSVQTPYRGHRPPQICHFITGIWEQIHRQK